MVPRFTRRRLRWASVLVVVLLGAVVYGAAAGQASSPTHGNGTPAERGVALNTTTPTFTPTPTPTRTPYCTGPGCGPATEAGHWTRLLGPLVTFVALSTVGLLVVGVFLVRWRLAPDAEGGP